MQISLMSPASALASTSFEVLVSITDSHLIGTLALTSAEVESSNKILISKTFIVT